MVNPKLMIFYLEGTLLDTGKGIVKCIKSTLEKIGFKSEADVVQFPHIACVKNPTELKNFIIG